MSKPKLTAFHNQKKNQDKYLQHIYDWLQNKKKPKTSQQLASELFNQTLSSEPTECVLENYNSFPKNLGLPPWLAILLFTINYSNSTGLWRYGVNYEESFYPRFIMACNVGADYSLMFHQWEIYLLTEVIPEQERNKQYFSDLVFLHNKELKGVKTPMKDWKSVESILNSVFYNTDEFSFAPAELVNNELSAFKNLKVKDNNYSELHDEALRLRRIRLAYSQIITCSSRTAFLSIHNFFNPSDAWIASSISAVDALWNEFLINNPDADIKNEHEFKRNIWTLLMNKLIAMLENWHY